MGRSGVAREKHVRSTRGGMVQNQARARIPALGADTELLPREPRGAAVRPADHKRRRELAHETGGGDGVKLELGRRHVRSDARPEAGGDVAHDLRQSGVPVSKHRKRHGGGGLLHLFLGGCRWGVCGGGGSCEARRRQAWQLATRLERVHTAVQTEHRQSRGQRAASRAKGGAAYHDQPARHRGLVTLPLPSRRKPSPERRASALAGGVTSTRCLARVLSAATNPGTLFGALIWKPPVCIPPSS